MSANDLQPASERFSAESLIEEPISPQMSSHPRFMPRLNVGRSQ